MVCISLPYLTGLFLPQRGSPMRLLRFSTPDVMGSQRHSDAVTSPIGHFCTPDLKHSKRHIWGCFQHLSQKKSTAACFIFQEKRMTENTRSVCSSNSAGKHNFYTYIHAYMCTHTDMHSHTQYLKKMVQGHTYKWKSGNIYQPELQSSALMLVLGSFLAKCIWTSPFQGCRNHTGNHGTWQAFPEKKHHK